MSRKIPVVLDVTPEEDAGIKRQTAEDPDTWPTPPGSRAIKRGRPAGQSKEQVTVRIDKDVIAALKEPDAKGWQTRLNALLREAVGL